MRTFPLFTNENRYDAGFIKLWKDALDITCLVPRVLDNYLERPILDQATPLVQSAHPSKIGNPS